MEVEYGEIVDKAHPGQIGLGLRDGSCGFFTCDMDQAKPDVAELAMKTRLIIRLDICVQKKCTPTDMVIVSLLAADERLTTTEIKTALSNAEYKSIHQSVTVNWGEFISDNWPSSDDQSKNKQLINLFTGYVKESQPSDFPLMDWNYISSLSP